MNSRGGLDTEKSVVQLQQYSTFSGVVWWQWHSLIFAFPVRYAACGTVVAAGKIKGTSAPILAIQTKETCLK